jgi:hypothetical protein
VVQALLATLTRPRTLKIHIAIELNILFMIAVTIIARVTPLCEPNVESFLRRGQVLWREFTEGGLSSIGHVSTPIDPFSVRIHIRPSTRKPDSVNHFRGFTLSRRSLRQSRQAGMGSAVAQPPKKIWRDFRCAA